jgi:hypothetical protein
MTLNVSMTFLMSFGDLGIDIGRDLAKLVRAILQVRGERKLVLQEQASQIQTDYLKAKVRLIETTIGWARDSMTDLSKGFIPQKAEGQSEVVP